MQPGGGDGVEVFVEPAGTDSIVVLVVVERCRVAVSQLEGRGRFPPVGEPVDRVEFDHPAGRAQLGEHATAGDGLELVGVTDQREAPAVVIGQLDQAVEVAGGEHAGFVDDHRGGRGQVPGRRRG